jgi:hypothetical protein
MRLAWLRRSAVVAVFTAPIAALGAGCSSNGNENTACAAGTDCVRLVVTGAMSGTLNTTSPPANFQPECAIEPAGRQHTWVSHQFGQLDGHTWTVAVEAAGYRTPGTYPVTVTLSDRLSSARGVTYFGHGTAKIHSGETAANLSSTRLNEVSVHHRSVSVAGTLSCATLLTLH